MPKIKKNQRTKRYQEYNTKCPECGNNFLNFDDRCAEITCSKCGIVIEEKLIDMGAEWRAFSYEEQKNRVRTGPPTTLTLQDKGLCTSIDKSNKDAFGKRISPKMKAEVNRLRKWNARTKINKSRDRNLIYAMNVLDMICSNLNLKNELKEKSAFIYRKSTNLAKGRSIEALMIASIYIACKQNEIPRTIKDFLEFSDLGKKKIMRCVRLIKSTLNMKISITSPINYIPKYCTELNLSGSTQNRAAKILKLAKKFRITIGKAPTGLAGAALYMAAIQEGERRTQKEVSITAGVTEATIRNRCREFSKIPGIIIN